MGCNTFLSQLVSRLQMNTLSFLCTRSKFPSPLASTAAGLPHVVREEPRVITEIFEIQVCCNCPLSSKKAGDTKKPTSGSPGCQTHSSLSLLCSSSPVSCSWARLIISASMTTPFLAWWPFGTRSSEWLGGSCRLKFSGTLVSPLVDVLLLCGTGSLDLWSEFAGSSSTDTLSRSLGVIVSGTLLLLPFGS